MRDTFELGKHYLLNSNVSGMREKGHFLLVKVVSVSEGHFVVDIYQSIPDKFGRGYLVQDQRQYYQLLSDDEALMYRMAL